jgi:hypothetical protein
MFNTGYNVNEKFFELLAEMKIDILNSRNMGYGWIYMTNATPEQIEHVITHINF